MSKYNELFKKCRYRELIKTRENAHEKGGGIGLFEIAKASDSIEYKFKFRCDRIYPIRITLTRNI